MAYLELNEVDRKKHGLPDRVEFEYGQWGLRSVHALKKQTGMTLEYLQHAVFTGKPSKDDPEKAERDEEAMAALAWLVLWYAGFRIPWDDFDPLPQGFRLIISDDGEEEDGGKEPETDGSSTTTTT